MTRQDHNKEGRAGIDYGNKRTNIDKSTGIRYGVINQNEVCQAWFDDSEADYGKPCCPKCGNDLGITAELLCDGEDYIATADGSEISDDYICEHCELGDDTDSSDLYRDEPLSHYYDKDGIQATSGSDGDIFITKSPYYTLCSFCSPCAPGAGYIMTQNHEGIRAYCFGHDWFESVETGKHIPCKYCEGTGYRNKANYPDMARMNRSFDDKRFYCPVCECNEKFGLLGKVKEYIQKAPYKIYSVETEEEVLPDVSKS